MLSRVSTTVAFATTFVARGNGGMLQQLLSNHLVTVTPTVSYSTTSTSLHAAAMATPCYLLKYQYIPDVLEKRGPYREGHLGLANQMIDDGTCLSGGPTGEVGMTVPTGAMFIFTNEAAAKAFVDEDPYVANGIVTGHSIEEWNVVVQKE
jgi:uncharacterized protein